MNSWFRVTVHISEGNERTGYRELTIMTFYPNTYCTLFCFRMNFTVSYIDFLQFWTCCKPKKEWKYCTCTRTAVVESGNKKRPTISVSAQVLQFGINYFAFFGLHLSFFISHGWYKLYKFASVYVCGDWPWEYCSATKTNKKRLLSPQGLSHHVNVSYIF